jgi:hypothetical protein
MPDLYKLTMKRITVEELEQNFDQYIEEVEIKKESFVFEYNGKDLMLIPYDDDYLKLYSETNEAP